MSRPHPALVELAAGRPLPEVDNHEALARSALEHRMGGLLWSEVSGTETGPAAWREHLAGADLVTRAHHQRLWQTLRQVSDALAGAGIRVATFKGVAAEARWYDRAGERPCADVDLLLDPAQLDRIDEAVAVIDPGHALRGRIGDLVAHGRLQSVELSTTGSVAVDLHADAFKLWLPSRRDVTWSRTVEVANPEGGCVRALDAEASLLNFLVHLTKDRFRSLLGHADVARVVTRPDLDLEFVAWWALQEGLDVPYRAALTAVAETLGLDAPVARPRGARFAVWRVVWRPGIRLRGDEGVLRFRHRQLWVTLLAKGHLAAKVGFMFRKVLPPRELLAYRRGPGTYARWLTWGRGTDAVRRWRSSRQLR